MRIVSGSRYSYLSLIAVSEPGNLEEYVRLMKLAESGRGKESSALTRYIVAMGEPLQLGTFTSV